LKGIAVLTLHDLWIETPHALARIWIILPALAVAISFLGVSKRILKSA
jgi:hypothetical protein